MSLSRPLGHRSAVEVLVLNLYHNAQEIRVHAMIHKVVPRMYANNAKMANVELTSVHFLVPTSLKMCSG